MRYNVAVLHINLISLVDCQVNSACQKVAPVLGDCQAVSGVPGGVENAVQALFFDRRY